MFALGCRFVYHDWPESYFKAKVVDAGLLSMDGLDSNLLMILCRFGAVYHDWPESYFKAQASRGDGLVDIFKQAMGAAKAQKITRQKSILARMFPTARLASMLGSQVS